MKSKKFWFILVIILALAGVAFFYRNSLIRLMGGATDQAQAQGTQTAGENQTVTIRPATDASQVSAAGNIALSSQQTTVLQVAGIVTEVRVKPGDTVTAGQVLVVLDTADLERAVEQAKLNLEINRNKLAQLQQPATEAELAAVRASLAAVEENLAELKAGSTPTKLEAAKMALAAAQSSYQELLAGKSEAELTQLAAQMHKAYLTLQQAQESYNQIAYRGDVGQTQQAMTLQQATIDYDTAKAGFELANEPATQSQVQTALKAIKDAQAQVEDLTPTKASLASAESQVAAAQSSLNQLINGPTPAEIQGAELAIEQTQLQLDEAETNLNRAQLHAPRDGTILAVNVELGQQAQAGLSAITLADLTQLELPVYVAEVDISKVRLGQPVSIVIDALPDHIFNGEVSRMAPTSQTGSNVVNYEVTIALKDLNLADGVRPGMTAVATMQGESGENTWLVPSSALVEFEGETTVLITRNGREERVTVTPGTSQGEWTVVQSDQLQAGDEVAGKVSSFINQNQNNFGGPFGGGGPRP